MNAPFTVGIIQDGAGDDVTKNVAASVERIREAAARGAQIVCLKELFNAPYFCKVAERGAVRHRRADSRARRPSACRRWRRSWRRPHRSAVREAGARRLSELRGDHRRRRVAAGRVSQDAHPRRSALLREVLFHAGRRERRTPRCATSAQANGFRVWKTRYATIGVLICWDQWYPRGRAHHVAPRRGYSLLSDGDRLASGGEGGVWAGAGRRVANDAARRTRSRTVCSSPSPNRVGHEDEPGTKGLEFFGHSFIADPFGRILAEAGTDPTIARSRRAIRADRGDAAQLAVPSRPADRRVRADPEPLPRRLTD